MGALDLFSWLPDWLNGIEIKYRLDTVIDSSEAGSEQARIPLFEKAKRSITTKHYSPEYLSNIENFLRKMHADFFQVPIFSEPIMPAGFAFGHDMKNEWMVTCEDISHHFNFNHLCSDVIMIDLKNQNRAEIHNVSDIGLGWFSLGGTFSLDFYFGSVVYYPVMRAYLNQLSDSIATPELVDTDLTFEEYF